MSDQVRRLRLLPDVPPGACPECAVAHAPEEPHDRDQLYYQYRFRETHGRWPTWRDALAHCAPELQAAWCEELSHMGVAIE